MAPGFSAVVVLDAGAESLLSPALARCPTIFVGEPRSLPFEQAKMAGRARVFLSYEESGTRLADFLPLVEELAEKQSMLDILAEKSRVEPPRPPQRSASAAATDAAEWWDFLEGVVENFDTRDRLIFEFRRASRQVLHASHAVFFMREADGFHADRGTSFFPLNDPMVAYFENHPAVVDGVSWVNPTDPVTELAVRNYLSFWGARLLVPVHDNGRLLGLIALGVRDDGSPYDESDRSRAVSFARLLRHFLGRSAQMSRLNLMAEQANLGAKYLPRTLVLGPDESPSRQVPLVVRELIGQVRRTREVCRISPTEGQPFRAGAGLIAETGGLWAFWEEASAEVHDETGRQRAGRRGLMRELGLTLSHELSNGLVSLTLLRQVGSGKPIPPALLEAARIDIAKLETLNRDVGVLQTLHEAKSTPVDIGALIREIGSELGLKVEAGADPVRMSVSSELIAFALRSLVGTIGENRPDRGMRDMTLQLRFAGEGTGRMGLVSLRGKNLELEGVLPEPTESSVPNQGRLRIFIAKEILRLHHGEIHSGPGVDGTEILFSFRSL
jgi:hypothetical protein